MTTHECEKFCAIHHTNDIEQKKEKNAHKPKWENQRKKINIFNKVTIIEAQ